MTTTYNGSAQNISSLELMTDADTPSGQLFRVPNERLLDMCIYLRETIEANDAARIAERRQSLTPVFGLVQNDYTSTDGEVLAIHSPNVSDAPALVLKNGANDGTRVWGAGDVNVLVGSVSAQLNTGLLSICRKDGVVLAAGSGNFDLTASNDEGGSWAEVITTSSISSPIKAVANSSRFYCAADGDDVYRATSLTPGGGGSEWGSAVTVPGTPTIDDICCTDATVMVNDGNLVWASNSAASVFVSSTAIPAGGSGYHLGAYGNEIYALRRDTSSAFLYVTTDSTIGSWTTRYSFSGIGTMNGSAFKVCPLTGLMLFVASFASAGSNPAYDLLFVSVDRGVTWSRPAAVKSTPSLVSGYACAAGRVYYAPQDVTVFQSQRYL